MQLKFLSLAIVLLSLSGCARRDLGDATTKIRWQKDLNEAEISQHWQADTFAHIRAFAPRYGDIAFYNYDGIQIIVAEARFESADLAFGFKSLLTAEPRNTFEANIWYRPPYIAGQANNTVVFAFSPNQNSFFSPFVQNEVRRRLGSKSTEEKDFSWHREILPKANRYADSEFYLPEYRVSEIPLQNVYGAKYQSKNVIARLYVARYQNENTAADTRGAIVTHLGKTKRKTTEYPGRLGSSDRGTWWKNSSGGVDAILAYRWLVLYFENYADEWHLEQVIQDCFTQMQRVRHRALNEP